MSTTQEPSSRTARPIQAREMGRSVVRRDGRAKVTGTATYAAEHAQDALHAVVVQSTIARGRATSVDAAPALAHPGVVEVLDHTSAPRLDRTEDRELAVLQDDRVGFRGQVVAVVLAESLEAAREGASLVAVSYDAEQHHVDFTPEAATHAPEKVNAGYPTDSDVGDLDAAMAEATVTVEQTYATPYHHNNPMEPHATIARWDEGADQPLVLHDSTQGVHPVARTLAPLFGLEQSQVQVLAPYVGGGFGSKGLPHCHEVVAALAAKAVPGRSVKLVLTRQQLFALAGYRTATISRMRLGADRDGRISAVGHEVLEQTSAIKEFAEQTATISRMMYAGEHRRTSHRLARLDVAVPSWMRAPGELPGAHALEVAMDELAVAAGVDPVALRELNDPPRSPEDDQPWNDRRLVDCLHRGADRFGWASRIDAPRSTLDGDWWVGTGMASATYPTYVMPGNQARVVALEGGRYRVEVGAVDIGTGAWTVLAQIAADALGCPVASVDVEIASTDLPPATVAGGSAGTSSWGGAVAAAVEQLREDHGEHPSPGAESTAGGEADPRQQEHAMHSFGAVFAEARVHRWTGEIRVPRMLGVYSVGRIVNPVLARSQFLGAMTMGLGAALFEESVRDPRYGHVVTQDLASYHVASHADVHDLQVEWLEESDTLATPMGSRGIGEIGIVGTSAAVANATFHATGVRVRSLPLTADRFLDAPAAMPGR
ncbi:xanthine dehydrogenase family protein molybdopterin-binding subunit [Nocardioides aurantiacus]|uniref:Xanthine dehydrogenase YagR molybdenum-binding subunit n=1 Tax=Nocardioides aurantiacus TaxID=86796 RepID=A0A3N2CRR5_9ACTN|nr:xanthine dehydrogenase family protein molybdopterin-binding subunit [Nocardioides aurantiacus]ROR90227.1 xanthine dehydrogenase YagR molybdenum-binding subunit [Nocardioides aurantiacus]